MRAGARDVLVVNAGSTGLKLDVVGGQGGARSLRSLDEAVGRVGAVGHRIVHGGARFAEPVVLDDGVLDALAGDAALAPLHNGPAVRAAREARAALPGLPHVAVFDTAFHRSLPAEATTYAIPETWRVDHGIRRYGFHGLSVAWAVEAAAALCEGRAGPRVVVCHLGGGASATAVRDGRPLDTSMGMSPLEGLVMATRAGSVDPDIPLHLILRLGVPAEQVEDALYRRGGLLALTGTADMRQVEAAAAGGDRRCREALAVHDHRLAAVVAGMAAALGGIDVLVFTGGVGEGSPRTREAAAERLAFLGVALDDGANAAPGGDRDISAPGAGVRTLVVRSREDIVIARAVRRAIARSEGTAA